MPTHSVAKSEDGDGDDGDDGVEPAPTPKRRSLAAFVAAGADSPTRLRTLPSPSQQLKRKSLAAPSPAAKRNAEREKNPWTILSIFFSTFLWCSLQFVLLSKFTGFAFHLFLLADCCSLVTCEEGHQLLDPTSLFLQALVFIIRLL